MRINGINIETVPLREANTVDLIPKIYAVPLKVAFCPICGEELRDYTHAIPVSDKECVKLLGKYCHKCDAFYYHLVQVLHALDAYCKGDIGVQFLYDFDVHYDAPMYQNIYSRIPSVQFQITVLGKQLARTYSIVASKSDEDQEKGILHYTDAVALKLLTAVMLGESCIDLHGTRCAIERVRRKKATKETGFHVLGASHPVVVYKKRNGGYYTADPSVELVNGLVFCSNSNRLEILRMSYDKEENVYYVDNRVYETFCLSNGIPFVRYISLRGGEKYSLRERSLLNLLGYNVGKNDDYSDNQRRQILVDVVDMGLCDVHAIERLLSSLISRNGSKPALRDALEKWESDREFITSYQPNPGRFVFVSKIQKMQQHAQEKNKKFD